MDAFLTGFNLMYLVFWPRNLVTCQRMNSQNIKIYKIKRKYSLLILGDVAIGKKSILKVYAGSKFKGEHIRTFGVDSISAVYKHPSEIHPDFKVLDTAGQERFRTITPRMLRMSHGVIIAFDLTKRETYEGVKVWMDCIYKLSCELCITKMLVGKKCDLANADGGALRQVLRSMRLKTSAIDDVSIKELMQHIFKEVHVQQKKKRLQEEEEEENQNNGRSKPIVTESCGCWD